ncbi:alkaline-phosphatase-like protein [Flammula alnicola]|nr:alkaline-phosphatase-like protein [Flammula alnicola]
MVSSRLGLLLWVFLIHLAGIYLFTRGFLLTRLSLSDLSTCSNADCGIPPTHKRAILLIIDSLRFDFITPNPPTPLSPFYHGVLTLPRELTAKHPKHSFIFNAYADPPTTTLQRIKGITTGSLPTFVDMGNNFGGSSIAEDSILRQLKMSGKKLAFMGDDTWMSVFPGTFEPNMTFPYDSFNVEDLHTVDEGVIRHLFPLLEDPSKPFDFLIGHFLGVDHVGHRVGPDHPSMKAKLQQMNDVLNRVVEQMDEDTLLVVLGDHGMDRSGDHGGDGTLETSSGMWIYSKGAPLTESSNTVPSGTLQFRKFPGCDIRHRSIQQIDILPTMSLLLGMPIPYNNLGTVIPELFWRDPNGQTLEKALQINAAQVMAYLDTYRSSPSGGELDEAWNNIQAAWSATLVGLTRDVKLVTLMNFNRVALAACRAMWAQFNPLLMALGLSLLSMSLCAACRLSIAVQAGIGGTVLGVFAYLVLGNYMPGVNALDCALFAAFLASSIALIVSTPPDITLESLKSTPVLLIIHAIAFLSNSFTFWEDRVVPFLLISSIIPYVLTGFTAPNTRLRYRILGFSLLFAICVRLISISSICREEQQPYCHVTFFASSSLPSPPLPVVYLAIPTALLLPYDIKRFLRITRSDNGVTTYFLPFMLAPPLVGGSVYWIMEWADSASVFGDGWTSALRVGRTLVARMAFGWVILGGGTLWWLVPLCLNVEVSEQGEKRQVQVLGYANAFGAPYLLFWSTSLCLVYICTQLTGQLVLALATVALIAFLEVLDSVRDVKGIEAAFTTATPSAVLDPTASSSLSPPIQFADIVPISLLGLHTFYGTGHQSTISSLQWKSAFLLTPTATYPWSVVTVVLNSVGPIFLLALAAPLAALWNRPPLPKSKDHPESDMQVKGESTLAALGVMIYYSALLLGTSVSAAILRRHLMVWKVFAPRFMAAVLELLAVDVAVLIGVGVGVERVSRRVSRMFKG